MDKADAKEKAIKGLQRMIKRVDKLEAEINEMRKKGLYPGKPGDPVSFGN